MAKTKSTERSAVDPDTQTFNLWLDEFRSETDRAAVILGAAKLDLALYQLLTRHFLPSPSGRDELFDTDQPVSTFSSRINVAYRLGLIDKQLSRSLHLIRRIRNDFAHEAVGAELNAGAHRDRVRELAAPFAMIDAFKDFQEEHFGTFKGASRQFRAVLTILVLRIHGAEERTPRVSEASACNIMPPDWETNDDSEVSTGAQVMTADGPRPASGTHDGKGSAAR